MASKFERWLKQPAPIAGYFGGIAGLVGAVCIDYTAGLPWPRRITITAIAIVGAWTAFVFLFSKWLPFSQKKSQD
jgi:hypothetical protein